MGNSAVKEEYEAQELSSGLDDAACLELQSSSIFNDAFAAELFGQLPEYEGTELDDYDVDSLKDITSSAKMKRLMQIFGKAANTAPLVAEFDDLRVSREKDNADYFNMINMRTRLLQRVYHAYSRMLKTMNSKSMHNSTGDQYLRPMVKVGADFNSADALLTATSIKMSLSIMACLGPQNPSLFREFAESFLDLLCRSPALALSKVLNGSPQEESVKAIIDHTEKVIMQSTGSDRAHALALLLALGISSGSVGGILTLAEHLKDGSDTLPVTTEPFLKRLQEMRTELDLSWPQPFTIISNYMAKISSDDSEIDQSDFCSTIACDGVYLYVWDGLTQSIAKIGTGFHGSIAGNEYDRNSEIEAELVAHLGPKVYGKVDEQESEDEEKPAESVENTGPRRLRMLSGGVYFLIEDGRTIEECFGEEDFDDVETVEAGFEAEVLSEHNCNFPDGTACPVYGIGNNRYIASIAAREDTSDSNSDSEDCSSRGIHYNPVVELTGQSSLGDAGSDQIKRRLNSGTYKQARIVCANGKIYLWMLYLLGPFRVAVFSAGSMRLESIADVVLPIADLVKGRKKWLKQLSQFQGNAIGEESKEEDSMCEEKNAEDDDPEASLSLGPEIVLCSPGQISVMHTSSFDGEVPEDINQLLGSTDFYSEVDTEYCSFLFGEDDTDRTIAIDLGKSCVPQKFGAKLNNFEDPRTFDFFEVSVSANNSDFFVYGTTQGYVGRELMIEPSESQSYSGPKEIQYVKFRFGDGVDSDQSLGIYRLFASGFLAENAEADLSAPIICSDGRYLTFLTPHQLENDRTVKSLRVITVDPLVDMMIMSDSAYDFDTSQETLESASFACNGEKLLMIRRLESAPRVKKEKNMEFCVDKFDMRSKKLEFSKTCTFNEKTGYPFAVSYDARNNFIWGWDSFNCHVIRWRNSGFAPRFHSPCPVDYDDMLLSEFPEHRLNALSSLEKKTDMSSDVEAATLLCEIDRLAEVHSPPILPMAERKAYDEVEVNSAGYEDGCYCRLVHRGKIIHEASRGFNFCVLNDRFEVIDCKAFDTHGSNAASDRMADFIDTIEDGLVVLVGVMDSAKAELSSRGISALKTLGAEKLEKLVSRGSYALIGCKGCDSGDERVTQVMMTKKSGPAVVKRRIPSARVPLAIDSSPNTLKRLIRLIGNQYNILKQNSSSSVDKVILLTSIRLCTTTIFHLLRGTPSEEVATYISSEERSVIISFVTELLNTPPNLKVGKQLQMLPCGCL